MRVETKEAAVATAHAVIARSLEIDALAKKLVDDGMLGLVSVLHSTLSNTKSSEQVQIERLEAQNATAARALAAWILKEQC